MNICIGYLDENLIKLAGSSLNPGDVYMSDGLRIHLEKHMHNNCIQYLPFLEFFIKQPNYVGVSPKNKQSIELVICVSINVQIAIKLDVSKDKLFVASVYEIQQKKLESRINSGRLIQINKQN